MSLVIAHTRLVLSFGRPQTNLAAPFTRTPPVRQPAAAGQQVEDGNGAVVDIDLATALGPGPQLPKSWGRSTALTKPSQVDRLGAHRNHTTAPPGLVYHRGDRQLSLDEHGPAGSRAGGIENATRTNRFDRCCFDHQLSHPVGC